MRHRKILGLVAVAAAALMASAGSASATSITTTTGGAAATPTIHWVNEGGHISLANAIATTECAVTIEGTVASHGTGVTVGTGISTLSITSCTNGWTVEVNAAGTLELHSTGGHNGTLTWTGMTITIVRHTIFGTVECRYQTNSTHIGTVTGGNPATLRIEGKIPFHSGAGLCGSGNSQLSGNLVTTSALYVAP